MRDFFLDWAVRNEARAHPHATVRLVDGDVVRFGYVPNEPDGTAIVLHARPREPTEAAQAV